MNNSPNIKQVETVLKYIKNELYSGRLQPGERLPAERRLADMLGGAAVPMYVRRSRNSNFTASSRPFPRAVRWSRRRRCRCSNA